MARIDYFHHPDAPRPNSLVPAASVVAVNESGAILFHRRSDSGYWSIPGGRQEPGETIRECAMREVKEETGYDVELVGLVGIFTDPGHVAAYSDGEVRQEFSVCFAGRLIGGSAEVSDESLEVACFHPEDLDEVDMHDAIRMRVQQYLAGKGAPYIS